MLLNSVFQFSYIKSLKFELWDSNQNQRVVRSECDMSEMDKGLKLGWLKFMRSRLITQYIYSMIAQYPILIY